MNAGPKNEDPLSKWRIGIKNSCWAEWNLVTLTYWGHNQILNIAVSLSVCDSMTIRSRGRTWSISVQLTCFIDVSSKANPILFIPVAAQLTF